MQSPSSFAPGGANTPEEPAKNAARRRSDAIDWLETIAYSAITVILLFTFLFRMVGISGSSMEDTLFTNDRVIILSAFYSPTPGDIVVVSRDYMTEADGSTPEPIIKRVIATEGQTVYFDYDANQVYVDGQLLNEPYVKPGSITRPGMEPIENPHTVAKGCIFVMGDNRTVSKDSRTATVGDIDRRYVLGRAVLRVFPVSDFSLLTNE